MRSRDGALLTDLYQLTMLQSYFEQQMEGEAVFEFFVRHLPDERGFLIAAGLEQVLDYLEALAFSADDLAWIAEQKLFSSALVDRLREFRFTGTVEAMREGTPFFAHEPIVRVIAPLPQAQFIESRLINILHFQTLIASKAARCVLAAPDRLLVDFGMRRAHGAEAGLMAARACYLAGFAGTATVAAALRFGIPVFGTMAHSYILAHDREIDAFEHFARSQPNNVVLLIDTYDTEDGARKVVELAPRLMAQGIHIKAVRLDSGDLGAHAHSVRAILDSGGLGETGIFASGNLEEKELLRLVQGGAPINGFGVGTRVDTSSDKPYLDSAYKLQEYAGKPRRKRSEAKANWPGRKQVFRRYASDGTPQSDLLALAEENHDGEALLVPVMKNGRRIARPSIEQVREHCAQQLPHLPQHLKELQTAPAYPVTISTRLQALASELDRERH